MPKCSAHSTGNRGVVVRKLDGLTLEQATSLVTPSGVTMLGVVRHLAVV